MHRRHQFVLISALVVTSALGADSLTPASIERSIATSGAAAALSLIYSNRVRWSGLLAGIASGEPAWLRVGKKLYRASDAGAAEQIGLAFGEALEHNAGAVLSIAPRLIGVDVLCGGPDVDDPRFDSYDLAIAAIRRREEAVRQLKESTYEAKKQECIARLESDKGEIARFYGHRSADVS
jgi:hypothetical protein